MRDAVLDECGSECSLTRSFVSTPATANTTPTNDMMIEALSWGLWIVGTIIVLFHAYPLLMVLLLRGPEFWQHFATSTWAKAIVAASLVVMLDIVLRLSGAPLVHIATRLTWRLLFTEVLVLAILLVRFKRGADPLYVTRELVEAQPLANRSSNSNSNKSNERQVVVVTGGNSGIGYSAAMGFVMLGAEVIIGCRDRKRVRPRYQCTLARSDGLHSDLISSSSSGDIVSSLRARLLPMRSTEPPRASAATLCLSTCS